MMIKGMTLGALWRRGWWVILLLAASDLTLGVLYLVLGYLFKPLSAYSFEVAAAIVGFIVSPVVLGLFFEVLASDLPRLGQPARIDGAV
jgi:voltage-gated potassium channel Kch